MLLLSIHHHVSKPTPLFSSSLDGDDKHGTEPVNVRPPSTTATTFTNVKSFHHHEQTRNQNLQQSQIALSVQDDDSTRRVRRSKSCLVSTRIDDAKSSAKATTHISCPQHHLLGPSKQGLVNTARPKKVTFDKVYIREHSLTVGDHQQAGGCQVEEQQQQQQQQQRMTIQLDWPHTLTRAVSIDDWEWQRQRQGRTPRGHLPRIDILDRHRLLRRVAGITHEDLLLLERQQIDSQYWAWHRSKMKTLYPPPAGRSRSTMRCADV